MRSYAIETKIVSQKDIVTLRIRILVTIASYCYDPVRTKQLDRNKVGVFMLTLTWYRHSNIWQEMIYEQSFRIIILEMRISQNRRLITSFYVAVSPAPVDWMVRSNKIPNIVTWLEPCSNKIVVRSARNRKVKETSVYSLPQMLLFPHASKLSTGPRIH